MRVRASGRPSLRGRKNTKPSGETTKPSGETTTPRRLDTATVQQARELAALFHARTGDPRWLSQPKALSLILQAGLAALERFAQINDAKAEAEHQRGGLGRPPG